MVATCLLVTAACGGGDGDTGCDASAPVGNVTVHGPAQSAMLSVDGADGEQVGASEMFSGTIAVRVPACGMVEVRNTFDNLSVAWTGLQDGDIVGFWRDTPASANVALAVDVSALSDPSEVTVALACDGGMEVAFGASQAPSMIACPAGATMVGGFAKAAGGQRYATLGPVPIAASGPTPVVISAPETPARLVTVTTVGEAMRASVGSELLRGGVLLFDDADGPPYDAGGTLSVEATGSNGMLRYGQSDAGTEGFLVNRGFGSLLADVDDTIDAADHLLPAIDVTDAGVVDLHGGSGSYLYASTPSSSVFMRPTDGPLAYPGWQHATTQPFNQVMLVDLADHARYDDSIGTIQPPFAPMEADGDSPTYRFSGLLH